MSEVFLLLGGNEGNKHKIFSEILNLIAEKVGKIICVSSIYETEPWGFLSDLFWNQALIVQTTRSPEEVLDSIHEMENTMGRKKTSDNYESRPIDIDIMFYDNVTVNTPHLTIPHPLIPGRKFVLIPLNEIAPGKVHPVSGLTIKEMLAECPDKLNVRLVKP